MTPLPIASSPLDIILWLFIAFVPHDGSKTWRLITEHWNCGQTSKLSITGKVKVRVKGQTTNHMKIWSNAILISPFQWSCSFSSISAVSFRVFWRPFKQTSPWYLFWKRPLLIFFTRWWKLSLKLRCLICGDNVSSFKLVKIELAKSESLVNNELVKLPTATKALLKSSA